MRSAPYAFAVGQLGLIAVFPADASLAPVAAAQLGLVGLLVAGAVRHDSLSAGGLVVAFTAALAGPTWLGLRTGMPTWQVALALLAGVAVLAYGVHRYELVRLELVDGETGGGSR